MSKYDAVLFDSDGVLVDPPPYETQLEATRDAFHEVGVERPQKRHLDAIVGGVTPDQLFEICAAYDLDPETFWEARERHDEQSQLDAFRSGSRTLYDDVASISELPANRGVVSNNHHSTIAFKFDFFDLHRLFDTFYGRETSIEALSLKKPNPYYLDRALADLDAESALYVGDSDSDVVAAHRAGVDSVFVHRSHSLDTDLSVAPTFETESLSALPSLVE